MFFLSPFVIHSLGLEGYGLWSLLNVLAGYMGLLDVGVRASTGRYVIFYIGKQDHKAVDETIRTSLAFFSYMSVFFIAAGLFIGWMFPTFFQSVAPKYHHILPTLMGAMAVNIWVIMLSVVISSVFNAHDRFDISRGIGLVVLAVRTIGTIIALMLGYGIIGLTVVILISNVLGLFGKWLMAKRIYKPLRIWPISIWKKRIRELLGYGVGAAITSTAMKIIGQTDLVIVGSIIGVAATGIYSAGAMLLYYSNTFLKQIETTFFPPMQRAVARGELGEARWIFFRQIRLSAAVGMLLYIGIICYAHPFIRLWLYEPTKFTDTAVADAALVMIILAASKLPTSITVSCSAFLRALGHIRFTATTAIIEAFLNVALSLVFVLIFGWGLAGVAAGTFVASLLTSTLVLPYYVCRKAQFSFRRFFLRIIIPTVFVGVGFAGICITTINLFPVDSWTWFLFQISLATICYIPIALFLLVPEKDRRRIYDYFFILKNKYDALKNRIG
jgi:O-antigen/teichoic acid export membrane protein